MTAIFQGLGSPPDLDAGVDQAAYDDRAYQLSLGNGFSIANREPTADRPPGTSFTLAPVYLVFGRRYLMARLWFTMLSALTCVACAAIARRLLDPGVGLVSGLWLALYPGHFYYSMHFTSEVVYAFWLCLGIYALVSHAGSSRVRWLVGAGVALGMAILTRPQGLLLAGSAVLFPLVVRGPALRRWLGAAAIVSATALAVIAPWVWRNQRLLGTVAISTHSGTTLWGAHNEVVLHDPRLAGSWRPMPSTENGEVARDRAFRRNAIAFIRSHPGDLPYLIAMKLWRLVEPFERTPNHAVAISFAIAWLVTGPLALLGLIGLWRQDRPAFLVLAAPLGATVATTIVFYGSIRFRDSVAPFFVIAAAWFACTCARWRSGRRGEDTHPIAASTA
jgi:4-amino-4-deoxy-L-arabinose transferase-like glycosyltransferase